MILIAEDKEISFSPATSVLFSTTIFQQIADEKIYDFTAALFGACLV